MSNHRNMQGWQNRGIRDALNGVPFNVDQHPVFPKSGAEFYYEQGYTAGLNAQHCVMQDGTKLFLVPRDQMSYRVLTDPHLTFLGTVIPADGNKFEAYTPGGRNYAVPGSPFMYALQAAAALVERDRFFEARRQEATRMVEEQMRNAFKMWVHALPHRIPAKFLADVLVWSTDCAPMARVEELKAEITQRLTERKGDR